MDGASKTKRGQVLSRPVPNAFPLSPNQQRSGSGLGEAFLVCFYLLVFLSLCLVQSTEQETRPHDRTAGKDIDGQPLCASADPVRTDG